MTGGFVSSVTVGRPVLWYDRALPFVPDGPRQNEENYPSPVGVLAPC